MAAGDPKSASRRTVERRTAWRAIRDKLDRLLHAKENRAIDRYRPEVTSIIETLDALNRDADGLRGRGLRGDIHRE